MEDAHCTASEDNIKNDDDLDTTKFQESASTRNKDGTVIGPVKKDDPNYNMNHEYRGKALIFSHKTFDPVLDIKPRDITDIDKNKLDIVLKSLGFNVTVLDDKTHREITGYLEDTAAMDHSKFDCLLIVILTYQKNNGMIYSKDTYYKPDTLWSPFKVDKCPQLAGKPKLFFIQACQLASPANNTKTDGISLMYNIPNYLDFLFVVSFVPGSYSWDYTRGCGSWFIQALCDELRVSGTTNDISEILTFVCQRVKLFYEFNKSVLPSDHKVEIPAVISFLSRNLVFAEKDTLIDQ